MNDPIFFNFLNTESHGAILEQFFLPESEEEEFEESECQLLQTNSVLDPLPLKMILGDTSI